MTGVVNVEIGTLGHKKPNISFIINGTKFEMVNS